MDIRRAEAADLAQLNELYEIARETMRSCGNPNQWPNNYPNTEILTEDIDLDRLYCVSHDGELVGAFVFFVGSEPDYAQIDGAWKNSSPYGVLHRVAAKPGLGLSKLIFDFAAQSCDNIRIDTHQDNAIMRHVLAKNGFKYCGVVHPKYGGDRLAFQKEIRTD